MSSHAIFFLVCLCMHACNGRRLGLAAEETGNHVHFLASKNVNKTKPHDQLQMRPSISMKLQTQELQEVGVHGRRIEENLVGANTMKQTLLSYFLKGKEAVAKAISGYELIISSRVDLQGREKVEGLKRVTRSMLGNSAGDTEEAVGSKEKENVVDIDVMDYAQPHRKPPIHNEKN
ncbi:uncharacterized protein LOC111286669 [Durio zibethinus]|uniref:Uncharacterized protein LOC111286669 n=1 Tax=Durio zibethinus TaxID=66656 RepID=A0A6P5XWT8_DURZI|nr:uncharacterized protein LOC111286669 [Durio zibethinus]